MIFHKKKLGLTAAKEHRKNFFEALVNSLVGFSEPAITNPIDTVNDLTQAVHGADQILLLLGQKLIASAELFVFLNGCQIDFADFLDFIPQVVQFGLGRRGVF